MKRAVCAIIMKDGKLLATHRRDNLNDWGLPGGKVDPGETDMQAIIREVIEESGYETEYTYIRTRVDGEYEVACYLGSDSSLVYVTDDHEHLAAWIEPKKVLEGCFGEFNKDLFEACALEI